MPRLPILTRTSGTLLAYWLLFVCHAIEAGRHQNALSRHFHHPWHYPVSSVIVVCILLAIFVAILSAVLRPPAGWRSWSRIALRTIYVLLLMFMVLLGTATDQDGIDYVPARFGVVTLLVLTVCSAWAGITRLASHFRSRGITVASGPDLA